MAKYQQFINAIQWTGSNVIEIRQFVRNSGGDINDAVIQDGILYLNRNPLDELRPVSPIQVLVTEWITITGHIVAKITNDNFIAQFEPAV
jgi:hypothetical protein